MGNSNVDKEKFYRRVAGLIFSGVVLIAVIFAGIVPAVERAGKPAYLDIVVPVGAVVEIDGAKYVSAVYAMEPGKYTAKVSMTEGEGLTAELNLARNQTAGLYLRYVDGEWRQYTREEYAARSAVAGVLPLKFSQCGTPATRMNCDAIEVSFAADAKCEEKKCLVISGRKEELSSEVLDEVRAKLLEKGYDLGDYEYIYVQNDER